MEHLRNMSYKELNETMAWISFILMFVSGGALLLITLPIWLILLILKFGINIYDDNQDIRVQAQLNATYAHNWDLLINKIISLSNPQYFEKIEAVLDEIDLLQNPPKEGSNENWKYLNQNPEIALKLYLGILQFVQNNDLGFRKEKIETLCNIGLMRIEDFSYVFKVFEQTTEKRVKETLAKTLTSTAHTAPIHLLLIFSQHINEDYRHLKPQLIESIINRAQDFSKDEIEKTLDKQIYGNDKKRFYRARARYFFGKAYDYSTEVFKEDANSWLSMIIKDFSTENRIYVELLDPESGLLLARACHKLGKESKAIFVLERILDIDPSYLPAISLFVELNETRGDYEKVKSFLIKNRKYVVTDEWGRGKLNEYGFLN